MGLMEPFARSLGGRLADELGQTHLRFLSGPENQNGARLKCGSASAVLFQGQMPCLRRGYTPSRWRQHTDTFKLGPGARG